MQFPWSPKDEDNNNNNNRGAAGETSSLLPSNASGSGPSYYFVKGEASEGTTNSVRDADGGEVIDILPNGANNDDFASRPIGQRPATTAPAQPKPSLWQSMFGKNGGAPTPNGTGRQYGEIGTLSRDRKVPIKVEPKVFFANERTFLAWLHASVLLAGASVAIVAFADSNPWSQLYGVILLPVAISFICYSMYQYARRAAMIRRKDPGPYEDTVGPTVLAIMLMISILAQFAIKIYTMM